MIRRFGYRSVGWQRMVDGLDGLDIEVPRQEVAKTLGKRVDF